MEIGRPFVGRSGKLLDAALEHFQIDRKQIYVTNVVKEMPLDDEGKTRAPLPKEVRAWIPILEGEIAQTHPKALLALGRTAEEALADFGAFHAWHPSYVLRSGGQESEMYEDWLEQISFWAEAIR